MLLLLLALALPERRAVPRLPPLATPPTKLTIMRTR